MEIKKSIDELTEVTGSVKTGKKLRIYIPKLTDKLIKNSIIMVLKNDVFLKQEKRQIKDKKSSQKTVLNKLTFQIL